MHVHMNGKACNLRMHAHMLVGACVCMHTHVTSIKYFLDHSFTFNNKVSSIVDDYLFNKETTTSGLQRKREPENIAGTKKSKKRLRRL